MKLLFATDGSPTSTQGIQEAVRLLAPVGASASVVGVTDLLPAAGGLEGLGGALPLVMDREVQQTGVALDQAVSLLAGLGIRALPIERTGQAGEEIRRLAERLHPDVIVVGSHGRTWFERLFLGSVSDEVAHRWHGAVLVTRPQAVPPPVTTKPPHVLIATDGSPSAEHAIAEAIRLLPLRAATVTLVGVADTYPYGTELAPLGPFDSPLEQATRNATTLALARAQSQLAAAGIGAEAVEREGHVGPEIVFLAAELAVDLVVVGSHGRNALARLVMGSVSDHVLHHGTGATLVVWAPEA